MEYRFSLTPRLAALGAFAIVALLVLSFALGYQLHVQLIALEPAPESKESEVPKPASVVDPATGGDVGDTDDTPAAAAAPGASVPVTSAASVPVPARKPAP